MSQRYRVRTVHAPQEYFPSRCRVRPLDRVCMNEAEKSIDSAAQAGRPRLDGPESDQPLGQFFLTPQEISMNTMITSRTPRRILATAILGAFACTLATVCTAAEANLPQMTVKYA